jgi:hypothetical protein
MTTHMKTPHMPSLDHARFDAICEPLEDFEPLPAVRGEIEDEEWEQPEESLDGLILAGLVSPN